MTSDIPRIPEISFPELNEAYFKSSIENYTDHNCKIELFNLGYDHIRLPKGEIMDICCGVGSISYFLSKLFPNRQITGIDINSQSIINGNKVFQLPNLILKIGDAYELQEYAGKIALATSTESLHHLDNLDLAIEQAANTLVPNGFLYIRDFDRSRRYHVDFHVKENDLRRMRLDLTEEEFEAKLKELVDFQDHYSMRAIASLFSHMAGYTCDEAVNAVEKQDLKVISKSQPALLWKKGDQSHYFILAQK